jgi:hypothetical protein
MRLEFTVPIRIQSAANLREHWAVRARRVKRERMAIALGCRLAARTQPARSIGPGPVVATLTRIAPRRITDTHDNLRSGFKGVVDELARQLGLDDGDERITWKYAQERGPYAVRVVIESAEEVAA